MQHSLKRLATISERGASFKSLGDPWADTRQTNYGAASKKTHQW